MSEQPLGVAIVGVGGIALEHIAALSSTAEAKLVGVFDVDTERAVQRAAVSACRHFGDIEEMLGSDSVSAVIVCTPNFTHAELGHKVLSAGKHLFMEKPLATSVIEAQRLVDLAEERNITLAVGHSHRFSDQAIVVNEAIRDGAIGEPRFVRIVINGGWIWPGWDAWVLNPDRSGGHSMHNGVHLIDLASWWLGEMAETVFTVGQRVTSAAMEISDYLVMELRFPSGKSAMLEVSRAERPRSHSYLEITVAGSHGVLSREWDAQGLLAWTEGETSAWSPMGSSANTFIREIESFVGATQGRNPVVPELSFAVHAVAVAQASELSLAIGETVNLSEITADRPFRKVEL